MSGFSKPLIFLRKPARSGYLWAWILLLGILVGACGESTTEVGPSMGAIEVTTLTDDVSLAPDSFQILLNGDFSTSMGPDDVQYLLSLPRGLYQVGLLEQDHGCRVSANPREVLVTPGDTAFTTFQVFCR